MKKRMRKEPTQGQPARKAQPQHGANPAPLPLSDEQLAQVVGGEGHKGPPNTES